MAAIDADDIQVPVTNSLKVEFFLMSILNEKSVLIKYAFFASGCISAIGCKCQRCVTIASISQA